MFPVTFRVACVCAASGVYRPYYQSRRVGEAVTIDNEALYVSHLLTESGRVVASLRDAARWLEAMEEADASPLVAAGSTRTKDIVRQPGTNEEQCK